MSDKAIKIAVSSCLLGNRVRYNGQDKYHDIIVNLVAEHFTTVAVCPEMQAGLGTPRPPVQLVKFGDRLEAMGVEDQEWVVTERINQAATGFLEQHPDLYGMILQSRSPSCGLNSTPVYNQHNEAIELGSGLFASMARTAFPNMPIKEDTWFIDRAAAEQFIKQVKDYCSRATVT